MFETNRIFHRSPMQIEKSQPKGKRIMPETRFTEFPSLSVVPGWDFSVRIGDRCLVIFLTYAIKIIEHLSSFLGFITLYVA